MRYLPPFPKRFKTLAVATAVALGVCLFFAVFGNGGVVHLWRLQRRQADLEAVAYALAQENQRLRDHLERLERDDRYLERLARERLGWIKPGEIVYRTNARRPASR